MNEEQMEAATESMVKITESIHKHDGWVSGKISETRKERIKRIRRWNQLDVHYPDRFNFPQHRGMAESFGLVSKSFHNGIELFITEYTRPVPTWTDYDYETLLPFEIWEKRKQCNGYCRFMKKPVIERGYNGILSYVPVHGGITYASHELGVSVYGFDTAHAGDEDNPLVLNLEWIEAQCVLMAESIRIAAMFEPDYLRFKSNQCRAMVIEKFHRLVKKRFGQGFQLLNNFGAMINVISGQL